MVLNFVVVDNVCKYLMAVAISKKLRTPISHDVDPPEVFEVVFVKRT